MEINEEKMNANNRWCLWKGIRVGSKGSRLKQVHPKKSHLLFFNKMWARGSCMFWYVLVTNLCGSDLHLNSVFLQQVPNEAKNDAKRARTRPENSFGNPSALAAQQHFARCPRWLQAASVDCTHGPSFLPSCLPVCLPAFLPSLLPSFPPSLFLLPSFPSFPPFLLPSFLPSFRPSLLPSFPPFLLPSFLHGHLFFFDAFIFFFDAFYFFWCFSPGKQCQVMSSINSLSSTCAFYNDAKPSCWHNRSLRAPDCKKRACQKKRRIGIIFARREEESQTCNKWEKSRFNSKRSRTEAWW